MSGLVTLYDIQPDLNWACSYIPTVQTIPLFISRAKEQYRPLTSTKLYALLGDRHMSVRTTCTELLHNTAMMLVVPSML